jgi:serine protease
MRKLLLLPATLALILLAAPGASAAPPYVHDQVIVKYREGTSASERAEIERDSGTDTGERLPGRSRQLRIEDGGSVSETVAELRRDPDVAYAVPNYVAHASAFYPNDPGFRLQWNFREPPAFGIDMPNAWEIASQRGAPGGRGAVVAVLDTGVAYRTVRHRFRKAPDLGRFVPGYDFVSNDRYPFDTNGHGTHVAGTIAQVTNNRSATAGIAYGARNAAAGARLRGRG